MAETERYVPGDPTEEATMLGPMARGDLRDDIAAQVRASIQAGARVLREGGREDGTGYFYAPTVLADAPEESAAMAEETFGPCAAIAPVRDADAAIALANRSRFGLSSNLWTTDLDRAAKLARRIEAGSVFVNSTTASDPRFPFGGIKKSGFGRELGTAGAQEFTNLKTIRLMNP